MTTRNGKIAKLPDHIREQLNARLNEGESGSQLVEWLNTQTEVQTVLDSHFEGSPISEQNLSQWRNGGFLDRSTLRQCMDETGILAEGVAELTATGISTKALLLVMTAQYAAVLNTWQTIPEADLDRKLNALKKINAAVLALRRSEIQEDRLQLNRERFQFALDREARRSAAATASPISKSRAKGAAAGASAPSRRGQPTPTPPLPPTLEELGIHGSLSEILSPSGQGETSDSAFSEFLASKAPHAAILSMSIAESPLFRLQPNFATAASPL